MDVISNMIVKMGIYHSMIKHDILVITNRDQFEFMLNPHVEKQKIAPKNIMYISLILPG